MGFRGTEAGRRPADTACHGTRPTRGASSASPGTALDDTALCRQRSADSSTSCTSLECVVPPQIQHQRQYNDSTTIVQWLLHKHCRLLLHSLNRLFSNTIWISGYQKSKTSSDLNEARDDGVSGWQWHQLDHMQTICTSIQTDNHANTASLNFFTGRMLFLMPNQLCQSTEGK